MISTPLADNDIKNVIEILGMKAVCSANIVDEKFDAASWANVFGRAYRSSGFLGCYRLHFPAPTSSISLLISDRRHAELRGPILIGGGYLPSFMPSYQLDLLTGYSCRTSGSLIRAVYFKISAFTLDSSVSVRISVKHERFCMAFPKIRMQLQKSKRVFFG